MAGETVDVKEPIDFLVDPVSQGLGDVAREGCCGSLFTTKPLSECTLELLENRRLLERVQIEMTKVVKRQFSVGKPCRRFGEADVPVQIRGSKLRYRLRPQDNICRNCPSQG